MEPSNKPSDLIVGSEYLEEQKEKETERIVNEQFRMAGRPELASDHKPNERPDDETQKLVNDQLRSAGYMK